ncbi:MAG: regulatory protein RecX [Cellvibrionaceae bacterium]
METEKRHDLDSIIDFHSSPASELGESMINLKLQSEKISESGVLVREAHQVPSDSSLHFMNSNEANGPSSKKVVGIGAIRFAAMSYLAAREHSQKELIQKLNRRFDDQLLVEQAVQQLSDEALQCDDRFTEAFTAMRKRKGQGPIRIAFELQQKGVSPDLVESYVYDIAEVEWIEHAKNVCLKKYGELSKTHSQKIKQMRFLQYRGFSSDTIRSVWR